jgi:SAM-dependent methyltransferase
MDPEDVMGGGPKDVLEKYRKFYAQRESDPDWNDKWQALCELFHDKKRRYVVEYIMKVGPKSLFDMGCGTGILLKTLRKSGFNNPLTAVDMDISPRLEEYSRLYGFDAIKANFLEDSFNARDSVIFFSSLHFAAINELGGIIRNLGRPMDFFQADAFLEHEENASLQDALKIKSNGHGSLFMKNELIEEFGRNGYELVHLKDFPISADPLGRRYSFMHFSRTKKV